jgi:signal transduction histidine kinase
LLLAVSDDGVGFDPESPRTGMHLGLASMRERLQLVSGTLTIESAPGAGTTVGAWVPLRQESE